MSDHVKTYVSEHIDVSYDKARCLHAAECVKGLPEVFDVKERPWIQPQHAQADKVAEIVERCPTGALTYVRKDGKADEVAPEKTVITNADGNRIYVKGNLHIETDEGSIQVTRATLCGCGYSGNKPFCDNSEQCKP